MDILQNLVAACQVDETLLRQQAQTRTERWLRWLAPVSVTCPTGEDPGYDDDFQRIREEVNKLSGIDTGLICTLAEKLMTTTAKDIRVATYYCWARLHQDGEAGFAEGLELVAGLLQRYGMQLHPGGTAAARPRWNGSAVPVYWTVCHCTRRSYARMHSVPPGRYCSLLTAWRQSLKRYGRS